MMNVSVGKEMLMEFLKLMDPELFFFPTSFTLLSSFFIHEP